MSEIQEFFAVTLTSVYRVQAKTSRGTGPEAKKIDLRGNSSIGIGETLKNGSMLAICNCLIMYVPEGGRFTSFRRKIEEVNTTHWGGSTSLIVALFKTQEEARACFANKDLVDCDPRWAKQTLQVVEEIGEGHPAFEVCRWGHLALPLLVSKTATA